MELVKEIEVEEALKKDFKFVDVRTKEEFAEFRIPGAYNVPLFTKEEREQVSKVYYEKGEKEARLFALKLVSPKLYQMVNEIKKIKEEHKSVAIYCWRGGLRSLAVATICNLSGVFVFRLKGGYRAFRNYILKRIEEILKDKEVIVLYGPTGVGKTRMLRELKEEGFPVLDLEGLAGHRGSVFGGIGLKQPSQKMFDALIWEELERLKENKVIVVEGESRKIGKLFVPESLWKKMIEGRKVLLELPLKERIRISMEDYGVGKFPKEVYLEALSKIRRILGEEKYKEIKELIKREEFKRAVEELMVNYYDKLYERSIPEVDTKISAKDYEEGKEKFKELLKGSSL
ncbi:tRNA 2-selenouridine(34) synthase MnmH [Thermovibrio sp.]